MLLTTLWECDQVLLLKWNHDGELELIADEQGEPCDQRAGVTRLPPAGGETGMHLRLRDGPETRHGQGFRAVVAIERADRAAIRERVPRRLPVRRGNRWLVVKQTCNAALHTLRTAKRRWRPSGVPRGVVAPSW